jgi:hypothetical protein
MCAKPYLQQRDPALESRLKLEGIDQLEIVCELFPTRHFS